MREKQKALEERPRQHVTFKRSRGRTARCEAAHWMYSWSSMSLRWWWICSDSGYSRVQSKARKHTHRVSWMDASVPVTRPDCRRLSAEALEREAEPCFSQSLPPTLIATMGWRFWICSGVLLRSSTSSSCSSLLSVHETLCLFVSSSSSQMSGDGVHHPRRLNDNAAIRLCSLKFDVEVFCKSLNCLWMFSLPQYSLVNEPLIELTNPGASGSLFYLTSDDEFIIKTVQHKEAKFLQRLLPGYYMVSHWLLNHGA